MDDDLADSPHRAPVVDTYPSYQVISEPKFCGGAGVSVWLSRRGWPTEDGPWPKPGSMTPTVLEKAKVPTPSLKQYNVNI